MEQRVYHNGNKKYVKLMNYKGMEVFSTNDSVLVKKEEIAVCHLKAIAIRKEALETMITSPKWEEFLNTILEHKIKYGPFHDDSDHETRTQKEVEVLKYLENSGYFK
ncbi:MAG: hypothetical protein ABIB79_02055 [archaeon]